ncbi:hypothetical protein ACFY4C_03655 [Actinomadura viridis]|uniref:hypothetical protein n=1 Tax=Actinomadura viridis TaxID=58110 RepID=UPI0036BB7355
MARRSKPRPVSESDDFAGIGVRGLAFLMILMCLAHPWQALKGLLRMLGRSCGKALGVVKFPFRLLALVAYERHTARRPTFEDYLRRHVDDA